MSEPVDPTGYRDPIASDEVLAQRERLADLICDELTRAGLPAHRYPADSLWPAGAEVSVDRMSDADGGGVFVRWGVGPELSRAAAGIPEGDLDDDALDEIVMALARRGDNPDVRHQSVVTRHMQAAIIGILGSAGLHAYDPNDNDAPSLVKVDLP
ncbi:hypothetical protein [Kutzneria sp. NPDC052558]|uniref:hypothetical protein n=1 Tax=Kutzneria sp. NPDC052558 TaxID=3364121 RepID=UPI0037C6FA5E